MAHRPMCRHWLQVKTKCYIEGCNSCASLAGLVFSFIACFILLVISPLLKAQFEEAARVNEVTSQLTQQTEYCVGMGAACATLLWRVSRRDDAVESLLSGVSLSFCYNKPN